MDILQLVIGILLVFFIPGAAIVWLFFKKLGMLEKVILVVAISITVTTIIGVFLAYTGLFSYTSSLIAYVFVIAAAFLVKRFRR